MELEVLLATMDLEDAAPLLSRANILGACLLVDQGDRAGQKVLQGSPRQVVIHTRERGLSRSRNLALENASADICALADDDEVFSPTYEERILSAFEATPHADIIAFAVQNRGSLRKPPLTSDNLRRHELMKVSSVQIAFRRRRVLDAGVRFDVEFGAGSRFPMGEELIFLSDARRAGLRICAVPIEVAHLEPGESSWFKGYDAEFFRARGASFARAEPHLARAYSLQWAIRKRRAFEAEVSLGHAIRLMMDGVRDGRKASS